MRTKVTLVLLFLNVALFFFIFRFERRWRTEDSWKEARMRVLGPEAADIRTLEISSSNLSLALAKRGDAWFITKPLEWPANPNAVDRIVKELQFLEHFTSFNVRDLEKSGRSLADYGLDHPKLTVTFTSGNSEPGTRNPERTTTLRLGAATPDGVHLYLLSPDGDRIHVVNQSLARSLALSFDELHADTIFTIPVFEARSLNLQTAPPANLRIRLRRDGSRWSFETPIIARASKNDTELAINALNQLRVKSFLTDTPPSPLPAEKPLLRISLEGNNRRETLVLGDPLGPTAIPNSDLRPPNPATPAASLPAPTAPDLEYPAQLDGRSALFTVAIPASLWSMLSNAQETLRETRLLDFDPHNVTAITLAAPGAPPLTLQRLETGAASAENPAWQIVLTSEGAQGPLTLPADRAAVARLLEQLSLLSAKTFPTDSPRDADLEAWGFNRPEREVTLALAGADSLHLQLGVTSQRDGPVYARLAGNSPSIYTTDPDILRETPVQPRAWRERTLRELPAGARIAALKLTDLSDNKLLLDATISAAGDTASSPRISGAPPAATPAIETILAQLRTLRAREFVLDQFVDKVITGGDERSWRYRLDATITLTGGAGEQTSTTTLFLTPRVGGDRQLAGSPANEFNAVFAIEQPFLDALWPLTEGRGEAAPPPAK